MSYKIAVASGKGGTGKTTVAVSIYHMLSNMFDEKVVLIDCDVEEPNNHIFFPDSNILSHEEVFQQVPEINIQNCTFCRKCVEYCEFNAIVVLPTSQFAEVNTSLCHSCGACLMACENQALDEFPKPIGEITSFILPTGQIQIEGKLTVGSSMQTMLIKELKKQSYDSGDIIIYDAPPGTSCSVVETALDVDYVLLVTEPTPFGLHDLKLAVELMKDLQKDFGVIINKAGIGDRDVYKFISQNSIELLGEIPFDHSYAGSYAKGEVMKNVPLEIENSFRNIVDKLQQRIFIDEGNYYTER